MATQTAHAEKAIVRVGAVRYLNARPLIYGLAARANRIALIMDVPSRLAAQLQSGRLDVALIPAVEYFARPGQVVVTDACVACCGPVRSVKLYCRVPPAQIRTLALDEGSRTSAALVRILLRQRYGIEPELHPLPLGVPVEESPTDATMLVGDRGMRDAAGCFAAVWDLGEVWHQWTGLPFVFALWVARSDAGLAGVDQDLAQARDEGLCHLDQIAREAAPEVGLPAGECLAYLRENIQFRLGPRQREGLARFYRLAVEHGLVPPGRELVFYGRSSER